MTQRGYNIKDAQLKDSKALPAAAATTVTSAGINLDQTPAGDTVADFELLLSAPPLATGALPDTKTLTYSIESSVDAAFTAPIVRNASAIVQTGAGGAGAAAATFRFRLPATIERYIRFKAVTGAGTGDCSGSSGTLELLF